MRIKFKTNDSDFPVLAEATRMSAVIKGKVFIIVFSLDNYKSVQLQTYIGDDESRDRAFQMYNTIQTSLGIDGYANLTTSGWMCFETYTHTEIDERKES